ncbi:MAG TPA: DUF4157 domain-containing protein [Acidimicrobiales bacterium]|nr:DUF4157 domain-containing protein [Acidimicrobiales bacterium]
MSARADRQVAERGPTPAPVLAGQAKSPDEAASALQRAVGNRIARQLLAMGQPSLTVGPADDPAEREADAVADAVVRQVRAGGGRAPSSAGATPSPLAGVPAVARLRRSATEVGAAGGEVGSQTEGLIDRARSGGGAPLDAVEQRRFGDAFGADLSVVRIHRNERAADLNDRVMARAFTVGNDIFMGRGAPVAGTEAGDHLLAHELTHTLQQGGRAARTLRRDFDQLALDRKKAELEKVIKEHTTEKQKHDDFMSKKQNKSKLTKNQRGVASRVAELEKKRKKLEGEIVALEKQRPKAVGGQLGKGEGESSYDLAGYFWKVLGYRTDEKPSENTFNKTDEGYEYSSKRDTEGTWEKTTPTKEPDKSMAQQAADKVLDLSLVEVQLTDEQLQKLGLSTENVQGSVGVLAKGAVKGAGKLEVKAPLIEGKKVVDFPKFALGNDRSIDAATTFEGFVGGKAAATGDYELGWQKAVLKGDLQAFSGIELTKKTTVVYKHGGKTYGTFTGNLGVTFGVGGALGGTMTWENGELEVKATVKGSLGLGFAWDVDLKIPTSTWLSWGWSVLPSWSSMGSVLSTLSFLG